MARSGGIARVLSLAVVFGTAGTSAQAFEMKSLSHFEQAGTHLMDFEKALSVLERIEEVFAKFTARVTVDVIFEFGKKLIGFLNGKSATPPDCPRLDDVLPQAEAVPEALKLQLESALGELRAMIADLQERSRAYRTCGVGMSRRADGTCWDHAR
ncbi:hypothetical protein [Hyphomicrobium sp. DY-1]|uniref:hypothetical protein n=1 Tax=Hyphomicrobium sp. DY-1 TaxID=3075650 RepID=UPI0039C1BEF7